MTFKELLAACLLLFAVAAGMYGGWRAEEESWAEAPARIRQIPDEEMRRSELDAYRRTGEWRVGRMLFYVGGSVSLWLVGFAYVCMMFSDPPRGDGYVVEDLENAVRTHGEYPFGG